MLLKPHLDPLDGHPRANYAPADRGAWFRNYEALLVHYAEMAARNRVEMFSIGCEFDSLDGEPYREQWLHIIKSVRAAYGGPLIYASGSAVGGRDASFWDAVDYIGVDAYNPLSFARDPSVAELAAGWLSPPANSWAASWSNGMVPVEYYRALSRRHGKPLIFTEIGYKSIAGDGAKPGDWKARGAIDLALQARAYEALFEVWSREAAWMKGVFLWSWAPDPHPERSSGGLAGYTPQNKPAERVITRWYRGMADGSSQR